MVRYGLQVNLKLLSHEESYNPSLEYIPTQEEVDKYQLLYEEDRPKFIPKRFESLRTVPAYLNSLKEPFDRCLDLYLCPRPGRNVIWEVGEVVHYVAWNPGEMLRRTIRLKREYLYRKSLEGIERVRYENKRKIKQALEEGKPIPTELRNEEAALRQEIDLEDEQTAVPKTHIDDEYANASLVDPKILITTSRDPSAPLTQFVKELKIVFPNAQRMNRGGQVVSEIIGTCRAHDFTDVLFVHEHRGKPDGLTICHLPYGPTAYFELINVVTRHEIKDKKSIGTMSEAYPHLILNNFTTKLGERTSNILKHLFPAPKQDSNVILLSLTSQITSHSGLFLLGFFISYAKIYGLKICMANFRHHVYEKHGGPKSLELKEVGPRFEMRLFKIKLGTADETIAQDEWVSRPYMNTAKKRKVIGD
ncbi:hypothetical protein IFM89_026814 [Coptis chinensis]|uniref:Brix domain-containing protein n=2 Tax=Magnoliopsida TaxID=3398 RepID=A0A835IG01_9MAGN|nr:hypothetical protein IFM89_026814 [Coptis chinensis]